MQITVLTAEYENDLQQLYKFTIKEANKYNMQMSTEKTYAATTAKEPIR